MSDVVPGRHWLAGDGLHVDTRGLEPPDPMVAVLWHLEQPGQNGPVIVHLDRNPVHLFPELVERGWLYRVTPEAEGALTLTLLPAPKDPA